MRDYKLAFVIIGHNTESSNTTIYTEGYEKKEDAEACLEDMEYVKVDDTYLKEGNPEFLYIKELHINKRF